MTPENSTSPADFLPYLRPVTCVLGVAAVAWGVWLMLVNDPQAFPVELFSVWVAVVLAILAVFLAAAAVHIVSLVRAHNVLLRRNAEHQQTEETLRESEERYRVVTESASDVILTIDHESTILFVNSAAEKIFGFAVNEMIGQKLYMLIPEHLRAAHAAGMARFMESGKRSISWQGVELPALHKNGHEVPIEVTFGEIRSGSGRLFTAVIRDITERKRSELSLRQSEEKHRTILETIEEGYYELDLAGNFTFVNDAMITSFRYAKDELLGLNYRAYVKPETAVQLFTAYNEVFTTGIRVSNLKFEITRKDGTTMFSETSIALIRDESGNAVGFRGVVRDVTENKKVENALRTSEAGFQSAFEFAPIGIGLISPNGDWRQVNQSLCGIIGYTKEELLKSRFDEVLHPDDAAEFHHQLEQLLAEEGRTHQIENRYVHKLGHEVVSLTSISLARDAGNEPLYFIAQIQDISERKRIETEMKANDRRLSEAQRIALLGSWELDLAAETVVWSDETYRMFGYEPKQVEVTSALFFELVHPDDRKHVADVLAKAVMERKTFNVEHRILLPDGSERILHGKAELLIDDRTGEPVKLLGTVQDITDRRRIDAALRDSEHKLRSLFSSMNEGLTQVDNDEVIQFVNDRLCEITGYEREEMIGRRTLDILFDDEGRKIVLEANKERKKGISGQYEAKIRKKSGEMIWGLVSGAPVINDRGELTGTLGMFMDISGRKRVEEQLLHDAFHDGLTGLANRALFMDHLRMTIERCKSRHSNYYAVLFLDFDRFKVINDSLGHAEGDELLKQIARRLDAVSRTGDLVARLGGDEFVILLTEMLEIKDAIQIAERIQEDLKNPFNLSGHEVFISASIGIALSTDGHKLAADMLRDADIAMYRAKENGKAGYQVFNQKIRDHATSRLQLETEIRQGIERNEFELYYQPIIHLETSALTGFEALVRWRHPVRGLVSPDDFIPVAEESALILPLGNWILRESCRQMREWQDAYPSATSMMVSVNLSCKQFHQADLAEQVWKALTVTGLPARSLKLEITESYLIENTERAVETMNLLRNVGVEISLDDFGTGYSSLSYLHRLPVNALKIDRSFIGRMTESDENYEIVRTIVKLAQNLRMQVIAEGIETAEQIASLRQLKCGYGQGYLLAKPLDAGKAGEFINENLKNFTGIDGQAVIDLEMSA